MVWVTWRQHRLALGGVVALLGVVAGSMWIVGLRLHRAYLAATSCRPSGSGGCSELINTFNGMDSFLASGVVLQVVPPLIGAFLGAPLLARELENGTFRFAWTQGFGRERWTLAKLVLLAVAVAAGAGVMSVLFSWYYGPYFRPDLAAGDPISLTAEASPLAAGLFDLRGVAFGAWTLTAFALGGLAGALIRRVVPAIAATFVAYTALALAVAVSLRHAYLTPLVTYTLKVPGSPLVVRQEWLTTGGRPVGESLLGGVLERGNPQLAGKGGVPRAYGAWQYLARHGFMERTIYQPASRFWTFQWIEGGWLLGLSVLLIAATVWLVGRRTT
jgi:hypothetical protein